MKRGPKVHRHPGLDQIPALVESDPHQTQEYYRQKLGVPSRHQFRHEMSRLSNLGILAYDRDMSGNVCLWRLAHEGEEPAIEVRQWVRQKWQPPAAPPGPRSVFELGGGRLNFL